MPATLDTIDVMAWQRKRWRSTVVLLLTSLPGPTWAETDAAPKERAPAVSRVAEEPWTVTVIRLKHAKAEQLAATLDRILPPGTTVVPDRPTNSLIISGSSLPSAVPIAPE
jgi:hypothetical protein